MRLQSQYVPKGSASILLGLQVCIFNFLILLTVLQEDQLLQDRTLGLDPQKELLPGRDKGGDLRRLF